MTFNRSADEANVVAVRSCAACGGELATSLLVCPSCGRLVHADALKGLAAEAERAEQRGDHTGALAGWRNVLGLLPTGATQREPVLARLRVLSELVPSGAPKLGDRRVGGGDGGSQEGSGAPAPPRSGRGKWLAGLGTFGILLAKFKWALLLLLGKGKLLVVGLMQAKTFLSMAVALGVYASIYGWWFALGLIVSIYIHEMGHVFWLRRYGIAATAPMFIPGLGAFVRLKQHPATAVENARVGLAGPVWGATAAIASLILGLVLHLPILFAIARVGAWINLFNLLPVWQLDGGRGFAALSRPQRGLCAGVLALLALSSGEGMLFVLAAAATFRTLSKGTVPAEGNRGVLVTYVALIIGLTVLMALAGAGSSAPVSMI